MMNIEKYPQYELYLTTLKLNECKDKLTPKNCLDSRGIDSTIISRAYYSAYSYALLWLKEEHKFKLRFPKDFDEDEDFITEHKQVIDALKKHNQHNCAHKLFDTKRLRKKADYEMSNSLVPKEIKAALYNMEYIINNLKFNLD